MRNRISEKQRHILKAIVKGNRSEEGEVLSWLDMDQLLEKIPYETSKDSMQFSLRHLIKRGYVVNGVPEIRRERKRRVLMPTEAAVSLISPRNSTVYIDMGEFLLSE